MKYWVSTIKMTVFVETNNKNIIVNCAPIVKKFKGQSFRNLLKWLEKFGIVTCELLKEK